MIKLWQNVQKKCPFGINIKHSFSINISTECVRKLGKSSISSFTCEELPSSSTAHQVKFFCRASASTEVV